MAVILIVEDHEVLGAAMSDLVTMAGHRPVLVTSAEDASRHLAEGHADGSPDLVLLDHGLPGMSGLDLLRRLRNDPRTRHVRVVMMSARHDPLLVGEARRIGVDDFLYKLDHFEENLTRLLKADPRPGGRAGQPD